MAELVKKSVVPLRKMIKVTTNKDSPLLSLTVYAFEPRFAKDLANSIIDELDNMQKRFKLEKIQHLPELFWSVPSPISTLCFVSKCSFTIVESPLNGVIPPWAIALAKNGSISARSIILETLSLVSGS